MKESAPRGIDPRRCCSSRGSSSREVGYEDSAICCWTRELAHEESGGKPSVISAGMFSGEFREDGIGAKQTACCQATDCSFSKFDKDDLKKEQRTVEIRWDNLLLRLVYESFNPIFCLAVDGSQEEMGRRVADPEKWQTEISDGMARSASVRSSEARSGGRTEVGYEDSTICCWKRIGSGGASQ